MDFSFLKLPIQVVKVIFHQSIDATNYSMKNSKVMPYFFKRLYENESCKLQWKTFFSIFVREGWGTWP